MIVQVMPSEELNPFASSHMSKLGTEPQASVKLSESTAMVDILMELSKRT